WTHLADGKQDSKGNADEDERKGERAVEIGFESAVNGERHRLGASGKISGEHNRRAEFAKRACPCHQESADEGRCGERQGDAEKGAEIRHAEQRRHLFEFAVYIRKSGLGGAYIERRGDERFGNDNGGSCEW